MNCPRCRDIMVSARATQFGEEYQYCKTCKKELKELVAETTKTDPITQPAGAAVFLHTWVRHDSAGGFTCLSCGERTHSVDMSSRCAGLRLDRCSGESHYWARDSVHCNCGHRVRLYP